MHVYTNVNEFKETQAKQVGSLARCAITGQLFELAAEGCTFNYATNAAGDIYSNEGSRIVEQRALLAADPMGAYVSGDGKRITDWKGNTLGHVLDARQQLLTRTSYTHGKYIHHYQVRDIFGQTWYGKGNPGIVIRINPTKATKQAKQTRAARLFSAEQYGGFCADFMLNHPKGYHNPKGGRLPLHAHEMAILAAHAAFQADPTLREGF